MSDSDLGLVIIFSIVLYLLGGIVSSSGPPSPITINGHAKCLSVGGLEIKTKDVTLCQKGGRIIYEYFNSSYESEVKL